MGKYFIQYDPVTPPKLTKRLWQTTSLRIQTFFRSSLISTQMFFGVEISDDRKYVGVRRLMAGLKQTKKNKKTLRRMLRAGRLLAVREGGILLGVIFKLLMGLGGSFSDK